MTDPTNCQISPARRSTRSPSPTWEGVGRTEVGSRRLPLALSLHPPSFSTVGALTLRSRKSRTKARRRRRGERPAPAVASVPLAQNTNGFVSQRGLWTLPPRSCEGGPLASCPGCHRLRFAPRPFDAPPDPTKARVGWVGVARDAPPTVHFVTGSEPGCDSRARGRWVRLGKTNLGSSVISPKSFIVKLLRFSILSPFGPVPGRSRANYSTKSDNPVTRLGETSCGARDSAVRADRHVRQGPAPGSRAATSLRMNAFGSIGGGR
jgi:hypothetical protein